MIPKLVKGKADFVGFALSRKYTEYIPIINEVFDIDEVYIKSEIKEVCYEYILNKLYNIVEYYKSYDSNEYLVIFMGNENKKFKELLIRIKSEDNSHITLKLKQAINFLKYYKKAIPQIDNLSILKDEFEISIIEYAKFISNTESFQKENFSQFFIPSFFDYNLIFEDASSFSQLSSGEKQLIFATNTTLYHLLNIVSVHRNNDEMLNKYRYVNIIYDEIELYYHPELQKRFLDYLLTEIKKQNLTNIAGINILLITHSPFILSDIPKQNILFLKTKAEQMIINGEIRKTQIAFPEKFEDKNSFGANITDLLSDSFFIEDGLIGDFAKSKIKITLEWLKREGNKREQAFIMDDRIIVPKFNSREYELRHHKKIIELVDEPLVKHKLKAMYLEFTADDTEYKKNEINRLEMALEKLKS